MVRTIGKLTNLRLRSAAVGLHSDGGGLYLQVKEGSRGVTRSWVYRYAVNRRETWLGLGSYPTVSLAVARERATDARRLRAEGKDPLSHKRAVRAALSQERAKPITFEQAAQTYIDSHEASWRGARYAHQWRASLATHVFPIIGRVLVADITTEHVLRVLQPIWTTLPETATQVRGRIEMILDYAKVRGQRESENVARWRGHLNHLLPARNKIARVKHHPALPHRELPAFMARLREREAVAARCLEFLILTASRSAEAMGARWSEIDLGARIWTIPPERTKTFREHRVPLSDAAIAVLQSMPREGDHIFPGERSRMHPYAVRMLLLRMGRTDITPHGFRASFRTWAGDETLFQREIVEAALGHVIGDQAERAYSRGDALEKRRVLMAAWADYCSRQQYANVIPMRA
jgi:integrase